MPKLVKATVAVIVGLAMWFAIATILNLLLRALLPGYQAVEKSMSYSLVMLVARLALGLAGCLCAGWACALIWRGSAIPAYVLSLLLLALFAPVHVSLWNEFPIWYHAFFLITLVPTTLLGFKLRSSPLEKAA